MPLVDTLQWDNFNHIGYAGDIDHVGIWEWVLIFKLHYYFIKKKKEYLKFQGFLYKEMAISRADFDKKKHPSEPHWYSLSLFKNLIVCD